MRGLGVSRWEAVQENWYKPAHRYVLGAARLAPAASPGSPHELLNSSKP